MEWITRPFHYVHSPLLSTPIHHSDKGVSYLARNLERNCDGELLIPIEALTERLAFDVRHEKRNPSAAPESYTGRMQGWAS